MLKDAKRDEGSYRLRLIAFYLVIAWFAKVLLEMVLEYRMYFPADFSSSFLMGKKAVFFGAYRIAFYSHIVCGPTAVLVGAFLMYSGGRGKHSRMHRMLGKFQMLLILLVIVPSGLVMAMQAYTGTLAVIGFIIQAIGTAVCAIATVLAILKKRIAAHQRWASRCFLFLCSPLILRIVSGGTIVLQVDTDMTYLLTAWGCWLIPLAIQELCWTYASHKTRTRKVTTTTLTTEGSI